MIVQGYNVRVQRRASAATLDVNTLTSKGHYGVLRTLHRDPYEKPPEMTGTTNSLIWSVQYNTGKEGHICTYKFIPYDQYSIIREGHTCTYKFIRAYIHACLYVLDECSTMYSYIVLVKRTMY